MTYECARSGSDPLPDHINLLGVRVDALNLGRTVSILEAAIRERRRGYVCICGAHGLVDSQSSSALRQAYNAALLTTPDGMPLVWELHRRGHAAAGRVYGPDLMLAMLSRGYRHALYGATEETLQLLRTRLALIAPRAEIVCSIAPPFRPLTAGEETDVVRRLNESGADIVWVGLGAPKQELWMAAMRDRLDAPLLVGVGAAFDFHAGNVAQAPGWMQRQGLEWLFRLCAEPRRLWRRYFRIVPGYLALLALQRSGIRRFPAPDALGVDPDGGRSGT